MKNILTGLSSNVKGILLIIGGSILLLSSMGIIDRLDNIVALGGLAMIVVGFMMAKLHEKIYVLIAKKKDDNQDNNNNNDQQQGPMNW